MSNLTVKNAKGLNIRKDLSKGIGSILVNQAKSDIDRLSKDISINDLFILSNDNNVFLVGLKLQQFSKNCYDIYIWAVNENLASVNDFEQLLSFVLYESFQIRNSHKISIYPCTYQIDLIHSVQKAGFSKEGYIRDRYFKDTEYYDAFIYSMLNDDFKRLSTGYIKIMNTALKVRATEFAVFEVSVTNDKDLIFPLDSQNPHILYDKQAYDNLKFIIKQLAEYDSGTRKVFEFHSEFYQATDFQKKIWKLNETIQYGQTLSYEALASKLFENDKMPREEIEKSAKNFSRAVGVALSKNPIMILIPCHRVIGKNGKLVGFAGGIELKDALLTKEMLYYK